MTHLYWTSVVSLLVLTRQLSIKTDESDAKVIRASQSEIVGLKKSIDEIDLDEEDTEDEGDMAEVESALGIWDYGGVFDLFSDEQDVASPTSDGPGGQLLGQEQAAWPAGAWKAPLGPEDDYPGKARWPIPETRQCTDDDMKVLNYWALKQAKRRRPKAGYNGTYMTGSCYKNAFWNPGYGLPVDRWSECYQKFYDISTPCAQCIGSVYNMAIYNWSSPCYNFCYGRPARKDGSHWCWEDCQSCMWHIGQKLTTCYGEPYDMTCRYAKELGKEDWFRSSGVSPKF